MSCRMSRVCMQGILNNLIVFVIVICRPIRACIHGQIEHFRDHEKCTTRQDLGAKHGRASCTLMELLLLLFIRRTIGILHPFHKFSTR